MVTIRKPKIPIYYYLLALLLLVFNLWLGYAVEQWQFNRIIIPYALFFLIYLIIIYYVKGEREIRFFLILSIVLRAALLFAIPALSDDVYRFIWDGRLIVHGINPFDQLPSYYLDGSVKLEGLDQALFDQLNSQEYFTIYPPLAQAVFAVSVAIFPKSILGASAVMKCFLLAGEVGSLYLISKLLKKFELPKKNILIYAINPLIIIEIMGNLHFEGLMIFFLLLTYYLLVRGKIIHAAGAMALSVASKLLPLIFLPFLIRRLGWKRSIIFFSALGIFILLLFAPLTNHLFLGNFGESLDLYFRRFEFNGSIYYLLRWYGFKIVGYNLIHLFGPLLAVITLLSILSLAFFENDKNWEGLALKMMIGICIYLALTTTVHPWYLSLPLVFVVFTTFRFPILWSGLIFLTYNNYSYEQYYDNLWLVAIEYILVLLFLAYDIKYKNWTAKEGLL